MRLISTEIAVNNLGISSKDLCLSVPSKDGIFHKIFLAFMDLVIFHQQSDEEDDLNGSGLHQGQFPVKKAAKGALSFA